MLSLRAKRTIPFLLIVSLVFLVGCDAEKTTKVNMPFSTAPSALHAVIRITDNVQSHSVQVTMQLTVKDDSSTIIRFNPQESLSCDNFSLKWVDDNQDYEARVPEQSGGGKYIFNYTNYGNPATITVLTERVPTFTSPIKDSQIPRSTKLIVSYQAPGAWQVKINATDGAGHSTPVSVEKNTGSTSINTSSLTEGTGVLQLVADYHGKSISADFSPVPVNYEMIIGTSIIWV